MFPLNAVRWRTPPREIAALVTISGPTSFAAELFHFGQSPRPVNAEFLLLGPGEYELTVAAAGAAGAPDQRRTFRVTGPRAEVSIELPPRRLMVVRVQPIKPR